MLLGVDVMRQAWGHRILQQNVTGVNRGVSGPSARRLTYVAPAVAPHGKRTACDSQSNPPHTLAVKSDSTSVEKQLIGGEPTAAKETGRRSARFKESPPGVLCPGRGGGLVPARPSHRPAEQLPAVDMCCDVPLNRPPPTVDKSRGKKSHGDGAPAARTTARPGLEYAVSAPIRTAEDQTMEIRVEPPPAAEDTDPEFELDAAGLDPDESSAIAAEARRGRALDRQLVDDLEHRQGTTAELPDSFMRELGQRARLPASAEERLVRGASAGDARARAELVEAFLPLIGSVARNYRTSRQVSRVELMQEGVVGVLRRWNGTTRPSSARRSGPTRPGGSVRQCSSS
jgi:hypothetical protein